MGKKFRGLSFVIIILVGFLFFQVRSVSSVSTVLARDPGVRGGDPNAGMPIDALTMSQLAIFYAGQQAFAKIEQVADGLGPTMNLDSCAGCHTQPAMGGTSPYVNPQVAFANKNNASNILPSFITVNGPVREARFIKNPNGTPDGGVHALFTIAGRTDAPGCTLAQPDFATALNTNNVIFRIPTPLFGAGLLEQIPDSAILANQAGNATSKSTMGISGRPNII